MKERNSSMPSISISNWHSTQAITISNKITNRVYKWSALRQLYATEYRDNYKLAICNKTSVSGPVELIRQQNRTEQNITEKNLIIIKRAASVAAVLDNDTLTAYTKSTVLLMRTRYGLRAIHSFLYNSYELNIYKQNFNNPTTLFHNCNIYKQINIFAQEPNQTLKIK